MKLNTTLIKSIARAYGILVDDKRQLIQGTPNYKYCIWEIGTDTYVGGWYPSTKFAVVDGTTCRTTDEYINALEKHIYEGV